MDIVILGLKAPFVLKFNDFKYAMVTANNAKAKHDAVQGSIILN